MELDKTKLMLPISVAEAEALINIFNQVPAQGMLQDNCVDAKRFLAQRINSVLPKEPLHPQPEKIEVVKDNKKKE